MMNVPLCLVVQLFMWLCYLYTFCVSSHFAFILCICVLNLQNKEHFALVNILYTSICLSLLFLLLQVVVFL